MKTPLDPLRFKPVYKDYIWGGDKIIRLYNRREPPGIYAESWEVSDREDGMSIVSNGPLAGRSLRDVVQSAKSELLGAAVQSAVFPLLVKLIDSRERLSVQVHPNDETARKYGGEAKTEMWYVLDAEPGAGVFAGLRPGVDAKAFNEAIRTKRLGEILVRLPVTKGDAIFIPGGLVHAIDTGCLLLEVQQNSNTTYRIYDWDRVGADGKARPLHLTEAVQVICWDRQASPKIQARELSGVGANRLWEVFRCLYFRMDRFLLSERLPFRGAGRSFEILFIAGGRVLLEWSESAEILAPGTSCLVPAALKEYSLNPVEGPADVLRVTRP